MKTGKKFILGFGSTIVATIALGLFNPAKSDQALATVENTPTTVNTENLTISAALKQFPTEADFAAWLARMQAPNSPVLIDDNNTFIIKVNVNPDGDDGWTLIPPGHNGGGVIKDATGATIDSFSRGDSRGATVGQIKAALIARDYK